MNEVQRRAYLDAMGIQAYFPRIPLPGAAPSRRYELPVLDSRREQPMEEARPAPAAVPKVEAPSRQRPARPAAPPAASGEPAAEGKEIRFRLAFWRAESLCVLNELPHAASGALAPAHVRLLGNLLAAHGIPRDSVQPDEVPFRWPFLENEHLDKSIGGAREAMAAWLQRKHEESPFDTVLLLGARLAGCLLPPGAGAPAAGDPVAVEDAPWRLLVTRSLDEMLRVPSLKREVWRDLRPVAGRRGDAR